MCSHVRKRINHWSVNITTRQRAQVVYEQIVNEAQPSLLSLIDNEGELSNGFSINQLVGQNVISYKKQTETSTNREFSAIVLNVEMDSFRY